MWGRRARLAIRKSSFVSRLQAQVLRLGRGDATGARRAPCIVVRLTREPVPSTVRAGLPFLKTLSFARCEPRRARDPPKPRGVGAAHGRRLGMREWSAATALALRAGVHGLLSSKPIMRPSEARPTLQ